MTCAWCERPTSELLVPGARGGWVHRSCEASRRGRRWFLGAAAVLAGAAAAAPVLDLVPANPVPWVYLGDGYHMTPDQTWLGLKRETFPRTRLRREHIKRILKSREFFKGNQYLWFDGTSESWKGAT